jgi:hypothetical protein
MVSWSSAESGSEEQPAPRGFSAGKWQKDDWLQTRGATHLPAMCFAFKDQPLNRSAPTLFKTQNIISDGQAAESTMLSRSEQGFERILVEFSLCSCFQTNLDVVLEKFPFPGPTASRLSSTTPQYIHSPSIAIRNARRRKLLHAFV